MGVWSTIQSEKNTVSETVSDIKHEEKKKDDQVWLVKKLGENGIQK